jgi:hypothetical protein
MLCAFSGEAQRIVRFAHRAAGQPKPPAGYAPIVPRDLDPSSAKKALLQVMALGKEDMASIAKLHDWLHVLDDELERKFEAATDRRSSARILDAVSIKPAVELRLSLPWFAATMREPWARSTLLTMQSRHFIPQILEKGHFAGFGSVPAPSRHDRSHKSNIRLSPLWFLGDHFRMLRGWMGLVAASAVASIGMYASACISGNVAVLTPIGLALAPFAAYAADHAGLTGRPLHTMLLVYCRLHHAVTEKHSYATTVAHHEAGHFLLAYLYGLPVCGYEINSTWRFLLSGEGGHVKVSKPGVAFQHFVPKSRPTDVAFPELFRDATLYMAGIVAECMLLGADRHSGAGASGDLESLEDEMDRARDRTLKDRAQRLSYRDRAIDNAHKLLSEHEPIWRLLARAMERGEPLGACCQLVADAFDEQAGAAPTSRPSCLPADPPIDLAHIAVRLEEPASQVQKAELAEVFLRSSPRCSSPPPLISRRRRRRAVAADRGCPSSRTSPGICSRPRA